jgi:N-acetylglucosaminyldiphosphoundecaprenol N-acetyl-beta-D-mannosaminyltransferase
LSRVFGIRFSTEDKDSLVASVLQEDVPAGGGLRMVATANADHVVNLLRNQHFRVAYRTAWATTADGAPVALYARWRGAGVPGRVPGRDLFAALMPGLVTERHRPFFVVSRERTGVLLQNWLVARGFAVDAIGIDCPPFGFEKDAAYSADLAERIREHGTTHLFMGVGSPKSEIWLFEHSHLLGDCYGFGVGTGIDYFVGTEAQAPGWMHANGLEWLWRVWCEPRRLARRYLVDAMLFPVAVMRDVTGNWLPDEPTTTLSH